MALEFDNQVFWLFGGALLCLLLVLLLEVWKRREARNHRDNIADCSKVNKVQDEVAHASVSADNNAADFSVCQSPNCVRCSRNREVLQTARTKLSFYSKYDRNISEMDILNLGKDLDESLNRITGKVKNTELIGSSPVVFKMAGLREMELWDTSFFPALNILEQNKDKIALEFSHLYDSPLSETKELWKTNHTSDGHWEITNLVDQGIKTQAANLCPITMNVLKSIPYFMEMNYFGNASFSVVHPQTKIATHTGSTNCRIRCHLGLRVPKNLCSLTVGDKTCVWEEGEIFCFCDAFPHSVEHSGLGIACGKGGGIRAVFMFDMWHPDVTDAQKKLINFAFSPQSP